MPTPPFQPPPAPAGDPRPLSSAGSALPRAPRSRGSAGAVWLWGGAFGLACGVALALLALALGFVSPSWRLREALFLALFLPTVAVAGFLAGLLAKRVAAGLLAGALVAGLGGATLMLLDRLTASRLGLSIDSFWFDARLTLLLALVGAGLGAAVGLAGRALARRTGS